MCANVSARLKGSVMVVYLVSVDFHSKFTVNSHFGSGGVHLLHDLELITFFVIKKDIRNERYAIVASFSAV